MAISKSELRTYLRTMATVWRDIKTNVGTDIAPLVEALRAASLPTGNSQFAPPIAQALEDFFDIQSQVISSYQENGRTVVGFLGPFSDWARSSPGAVSHNPANDLEVIAAFLTKVVEAGEWFDPRDVTLFDSLSYIGPQVQEPKLITVDSDGFQDLQLVNIEEVKLLSISDEEFSIDAEAWQYIGEFRERNWLRPGSIDNGGYVRGYGARRSNARATAAYELAPAQFEIGGGVDGGQGIITTVTPWRTSTNVGNMVGDPAFSLPLLPDDAEANFARWFIISGSANVSRGITTMPRWAALPTPVQSLTFTGNAKVGIRLDPNTHPVQTLRFIDAMVRRTSGIGAGEITLRIEGGSTTIEFVQDLTDFPAADSALATAYTWFNSSLTYRLPYEDVGADLRLTIEITNHPGGGAEVEVIAPVCAPITLVSGAGMAILPGRHVVRRNDGWEFEHTIDPTPGLIADFLVEVWNINPPSDGTATDQYWTDS